jgi:hypothetical protein
MMKKMWKFTKYILAFQQITNVLPIKLQFLIIWHPLSFFCKECDCKKVAPMLIAFGHATSN